MPEPRDFYTIAQFSDIHCGDSRFDSDLMEATIHEINAIKPDLVIVAGDLTSDGYREQFDEAHSWIRQVECEQKLVIAGNHDCRNVGYLHFEQIFGSRHYRSEELDFRICCVPDDEGIQERVKILALDSNKPDLNDGEIGRDKYDWIDLEFPNPEDFKIFLLHHHLVSIPGTGRERNIVLDAGDVLDKLREVDVDLVLCGHRHVPYTWPLADMLIISSGTASTWRTRGFIQPSYNIITIEPATITVANKTPGDTVSKKQSFPRKPRRLRRV
ncbi:MAG: metallophosphoesterase [Actinobacteria bacterium]|nr:metallophosphoesterase [Actinomycetota bacterium]